MCKKKIHISVTDEYCSWEEMKLRRNKYIIGIFSGLEAALIIADFGCFELYENSLSQEELYGIAAINLILALVMIGVMITLSPRCAMFGFVMILIGGLTSFAGLVVRLDLKLRAADEEITPIFTIFGILEFANYFLFNIFHLVTSCLCWCTTSPPSQIHAQVEMNNDIAYQLENRDRMEMQNKLGLKQKFSNLSNSGFFLQQEMNNVSDNISMDITQLKKDPNCQCNNSIQEK